MDDVTAWVKGVFAPSEAGEALSPWDLLFRLLLALVLGLAIAVVYRFTHRGASPATPTFVTTLVLLCILLAMVPQVIGNSAALAFSLAGILSIVRFRTVVEDTRDTAFVILSVILGMATGLGNFTMAFVGLAVVTLAAVLLARLPIAASLGEGEWILQLRVSPGAGNTTVWEAVFAKHCSVAQFVATATVRQGAALDLTYKLTLKAGVAPLQLLNELNQIEGVQNLEMKRS